MRRLWRWFAALAVCAATVGPLQAQPVTLADDRGRSVTLPAPPRRIVSLSPALTESVCVLGACDRLVGVDRFSDWPASVAALPRLGGLEDTPIERLVRLQPDLVLVATSSRAIGRLESLGLTVLALEPRRFSELQRTLDTLARALGRPGAAAPAWQSLDARMTAASARVPPAFRGQRVYFEVASSPYAAGEASFIGEVLGRLGLANVVPAALGPFPLLNPEFVLRAAPDLVMASAAELAAMPRRPGWSALAALRGGQACGFAPAAYDTLMRAGPRLADGAEAIADCLARLATPTGAVR